MAWIQSLALERPYATGAAIILKKKKKRKKERMAAIKSKRTKPNHLQVASDESSEVWPHCPGDGGHRGKLGCKVVPCGASLPQSWKVCRLPAGHL